MILKRLWKVLIAVPPVWVLVINQLLFGQVGLAEGHPNAIVACKGNIVYKRAVKVSPDQVFASNGLLAEFYDTNNDGRFDVITLSHLNGTTQGRGQTTHKKNPVFWMVDLDFNGSPDAVYIDKKGLGKCTDIVLYQDLNVFEGGTNDGQMDDNSIDKGRRL